MRDDSVAVAGGLAELPRSLQAATNALLHSGNDEIAAAVESEMQAAVVWLTFSEVDQEVPT
jgi:hypothetical protein